MDMELQVKILKWLLGQAFRADGHRRQLERRLAKVSTELGNQVKAVRYTGMPKGNGSKNQMEDLAAGKADLEAEIRTQIERVDAAKLSVMRLIDHVPIGDVSRQIMELRHVDFMNWYEIGEVIHMSRQQCSRHYRRACRSLLDYPDVAEMVAKAEKTYLIWRRKSG